MCRAVAFRPHADRSEASCGQERNILAPSDARMFMLSNHSP